MIFTYLSRDCFTFLSTSMYFRKYRKTFTARISVLSSIVSIQLLWYV